MANNKEAIWLNGSPVLVHSPTSKIDVAWVNGSPTILHDSTLVFYNTDFSEYTTGSAPSDWTDFWETGDFTSNIDNTTELISGIGSKYLDYTTTVDGRSVLTWDDVGDVEDVDIYAKIEAPSTALGSGDYIRVYARVSGTGGSENSYHLALGDGKVYVARYLGGSATAVGSESCSFSFATSPIWVRFQVIGTAIKVKVWDGRAPEPADWILEETDSGLTSGAVGVGAYPATGDFKVDYFSVTTGGAASGVFPPDGFESTRFGYFEYPDINWSATASVRAMGGMFGDIDKLLTGVGVWTGVAHTNQARLAVYSGGSLVTGPQGATLLYDFGLTSGSDVNTLVTILGASVVIPKNEPLWVFFKLPTSFNVRYGNDLASAGNFQTATGRFDIESGVSIDPTVAYPDTIPTITVSDSAAWYGFEVIIEDPAGGQAYTPVASPEAGAYGPLQLITLTCATPDSTIYYTLDGTTPTESSTEYTEPFTLGAAKTIKALAVSDAYEDSEILSATYTIASYNAEVSKAVGYAVLSVPDGSVISKAVGYAVLSTEVNVGISKAVAYAVLSPKITAKSVILDMGYCWDATSYMVIRSMEFYLGGSLIPMTSGFTAYATSTYDNSGFNSAFVFNTSLSKTGPWLNTSWISVNGTDIKQRLIIVFDTPLAFDKVVINNGHNSGGGTTNGAKSVRLLASSDTITDTTFNAPVANATQLFYDDLPEHVGSDVIDDIVVYGTGTVETVPEYIGSGAGTEADPFMVTTEAELIDMCNWPRHHYELANDIALVNDWVLVPNWCGTFNGANHKITNFNCTNLSGHAGMFAATGEGNFTLHNLEIHGGDTGLVTTDAYYCGYLVVSQYGVWTFDIHDCLVNGKYTPGGDKGAGVVGVTQANPSSVQRVVANCLRVNSGRGNGLLYQYNSTVDATGSYYNYTLCPFGTSYGGEVGLTTTQFESEVNFPGLDFDGVWDHDGTMPRLIGNVEELEESVETKVSKGVAYSVLSPPNADGPVVSKGVVYSVLAPPDEGSGSARPMIFIIT